MTRGKEKMKFKEKKEGTTRADRIALTCVPACDGDKSPHPCTARCKVKKKGITRGRNASPRFDMGHEFALSRRGRKIKKRRDPARDGGFVTLCINLPDYSGFMVVSHSVASSPLLTRFFPSFSDL